MERERVDGERERINGERERTNGERIDGEVRCFVLT
jgi:hypothetical protein